MPFPKPHCPAPGSALLFSVLAGSVLLFSQPASALRPAVPPPSATAPSGFEVPSATHCRRPPNSREVPGQAVRSETRASVASVLGRTHDPAERAAAEAPFGPAAPASAPTVKPAIAPEAQRQQPIVTAGMVDDNADFAEYLAFRARTPVAHQRLDISERHLLVVRDLNGQGVPDARVRVQSPYGEQLWARTDSAGRVWLHPRSFDASNSRYHEVAVSHGDQTTWGILQRGQRDALELTLPGTAQAQRTRLDLVFLIDATGSMADEIQKLKHSLHSIAAEAARLPSRPDLCFGLVAYRDINDPFVLRSHDFTNDLAAFQAALDSLQADGGGDTPEAMGEALHETVHRLSWRGDGTTRMVVLLADAPPQIGPKRPAYNRALQAALGKGIKIFSVGASGLDPQGEFIQRQIAQYTGGRFVFLTYERAEDPPSGPGRQTVHDVSSYSVDTLDRLIGRLIREELAPLSRQGS